jgi:hypothetical protein
VQEEEDGITQILPRTQKEKKENKVMEERSGTCMQDRRT